MINILIVYFVAINVTAFAAFGVDKWKAKNGKWRFPESILMWLTALGGAVGAWFGMKLFRHKTQHKKFTILVPLFMLFWVIAIGYGATQMGLN